MSDLEKLASDPRVTVRRKGAPDPDGKCVVYWMQRAQRGRDNPALNVAVEAANHLRLPLVVFFAPVPFYPGSNQRHYKFLADGIPDIAEDLERRRIGFILRPYPDHNLLKFCQQVQAAMIVGDENPLRQPASWRRKVAKTVPVPLWTVDADVIVPSSLLEREQFAARTIRPRIHKLLPQYLVPLRNPEAHVPPPRRLRSWPIREDFTSHWDLDRSVQPVSWRGGSREALRRLREFVRVGLHEYPTARNHPELDGTSRLSPYLHFGHIGPHTIAGAIQRAEAPQPAKDAFLEQLIVRRELAINFVRFNPAYDSIDSMEPWAARSLAEHARDRRPVTYTEHQLENADTHDRLWNAAQKQMVLGGWMHNYLRMYWAKKILEWSPSIAVALQRSIRLNDKYELDGRDPNGYAGIAWAILGKHDRAWSDRPVFGKIRYMSFESTSTKFDSKTFIHRMGEPKQGAGPWQRRENISPTASKNQR
ncbi:MAG TPA: deoxyribodipyrimidine photo-lyase [Terriglobales bacterium]